MSALEFQPEINLIRYKIRNGSEPDNPTLFFLWFNYEEKLLSDDNCLKFQRSIYESQFNLLLDAVIDELVPKRWRCQCLDQIYRPLTALKRISNNKESESQIKRLLYELSVTSHYVENSLMI